MLGFFIDYNVCMQITHTDRETLNPDNGHGTQSGNLILVGMMGSGKTTIGRALARHLGKTFVDTDEEITKRTGVTIPHIFDVEGEAGFRQRESAILRELTGRDNVVISTGGGVVLDEQNRALLRQHGIVIYLKAGIQDLWQRTRHDRNRPLLQTEDPYARLKELLQLRDPLYREVADIVIHSSKQSANALMLHLVDKIEAFRRISR